MSHRLFIDLRHEHRYNRAREIKNKQDDFCAKVEAGRFDEVKGTPFPEDLQWEALVDVLRGRVKVCTTRDCPFVDQLTYRHSAHRCKSTATSLWTSTMSFA